MRRQISGLAVSVETVSGHRDCADSATRSTRAFRPCRPVTQPATMGFVFGDQAMREVISSSGAPAAIGTYSQAIKCGHTVYLSGQIPLDPANGQMVEGAIEVHIRRVFDNLRALCVA